MTLHYRRADCDVAEGELLTAADVARALKVSEKHAWRVIAANDPVHIGRSVRWTPAQLAAFLEARGVARVRGGGR
jgi:hypothetical protein